MNNCLVYRNLRYAAAKRFAPAEQLKVVHSDIHNGRERGSLAPQHTSRFDALLGPPAPLTQSEDCQTLSIFTTSNIGSRPVMIWFHGGANITGGGELPWYDGDKLASEHELVVVTVTARLGVFGYLYNDALFSSNSPSPAMTDQLIAIRWVHQNIAMFGGDPNNVTLFGQSAGAFSIEVMLRWGLDSYVKRAIIQSSFLGQKDIIYDQKKALNHSHHFNEFIGCDPKTLSTAELLDAQLKFSQFLGRSELWAPVRPQIEKPITIPVLSGWTSEDTLPFIYMSENVTKPTNETFITVKDRVLSDNMLYLTDCTKALLCEVAINGQSGWAYEFSWQAPQSGWKASHCIELPFLLGSYEAWKMAPMLSGLDKANFEEKGRQLRSMWANFVLDLPPAPTWIPSTETECAVNPI